MKVKLGDLEDLKQCALLSRIPEFTTTKSMSDKEILEYFADYVKKGIMLVAKENDEVLGFITGEYMLNNYVWIDAIVVKPEIRGKGVGKLLFSEFKELLKKKKVKHIYLMAPKFNTNTVAFYQSIAMKKGEEFIEFTLDL
ncbi:MAG: GNAT family N-acetyltransferase [archaeon]